MTDSKRCAPGTQEEAKAQSAEAEACRLAAHMMVRSAFNKAVHKDEIATLQQVSMMLQYSPSGPSLCCIFHFVPIRGMSNRHCVLS